MLSRGALFVSRSENWFLKHAKKEMQDLYELASKHLKNLPTEIYEFERTADKSARRELKKTIKEFDDVDRKIFNEHYLKMCHKVAQISADIFNNQFRQTFQTGQRSAFIDNIVKTFFRLNSVPYLLIGTDRSQPFAVIVPNITQWKQHRSIRNVYAQPDLKSGQCVVNFDLECENKDTFETKCYKFHAEIRWSHGKFCGNPESKLYKDFGWQDVIFLTNIV